MEDDYNGYLSFTSLEPPTPSRLNPTFTFPRRGLASLQSPRLSILPPMSRTKHPNKEFELRNNTRRSSSETPPRLTSVIDTKLLRHTLKAKMAQRRGSLEVIGLFLDLHLKYRTFFLTYLFYNLRNIIFFISFQTSLDCQSLKKGR